MLRAALWNFFQGNARNGGNFFIGQFPISEHSIDHFELGFCSPFFFTFMKIKFISHILAPYESVILVKRYLVVDRFGFMGVRVLGREIFHVRPNNRIREVPVLLQIYKKAESCKFCNQPFAKNFILKTKELQQKEFTKRLQ